MNHPDPGWDRMYSFQNGSSTSGILNKSIVSAKFTCDDLCGESESYWERERVRWWYFALIKCGNIVSGWLWIVLSVPRTWLILWVPEVVDRQISGMSWRSVIRILCTSMKPLYKCLVEVILSWTTDCGVKKGGLQVCFSRWSRYEPHSLNSLRDWKVIISVLLNVVHFLTNLSLLPRATFRVLAAINSSVLNRN